jgi:putative transposase
MISLLLCLYLPFHHSRTLDAVSFCERLDKKYREIRSKWYEHWDGLMAFMDYGQNIRRMIYTTNPVEALHRVMRKVTKSKEVWSNNKGLLKQ